MKISKLFTLVAFLVFTSLAGNAAMRYRWQTPVNQSGQPDSFALPCEPVKLLATAGGALATYGVGKSTPLAEAGAVYWAIIDKASTAGDYITFRDSATANSTSASILVIANESATGSKLVQFNPPLALVNGLSIDTSTASTGVTVCVREADGGI